MSKIPTFWNAANVRKGRRFIMKFCPNCGQQNQDDARFCVSCGSKLETEQTSDTGEKQTAAGPAPVKMPSDAGNEKAKTNIPPAAGKAGIGIVALIVLLVVIFKVAGCGKTKVDLNDYLSISVAGTDTVGTASYSFDSNGLFMKLAKTIGVNDEDAADPYYLLNSLTSGSKKWKKLSDLYSMMDSTFQGSLDKTTDLSNGDEIVFEWNNNKDQMEQIEKDFKVSFSCKEMKKDVEGLAEIEEFDPFEDIEVKFSGYAPNGTAEIQNNSEYDYETPYLDYELDKREGLSNGDKVTVSISGAVGNEDAFRENCIRDWGAAPSAVSKEYTVEGLDEMEDYDPFEYISVTFSGTSPDTTLNITNNTGIEDLEFEADKYDKLKLGDTVTITAKGYYDEDPAELCAYEGKNLTVTSKEYTVENVPKYADQLSEIPQDMLDKMDQNAQDKLNAYAANNWSDEEKLVGISLEGEYFLYVKDGADTYDYWSGESTYNKLFLVYKVSVEAGGKAYEYYYYSRFSNIIIMEDGTCSLDMSAIATPDDTTSVDGYYYYYGYADLDTLKYKTVTANLDNYTYEEKFD